MKRLFLAIALGAISAGAAYLDGRPDIRHFLHGWLGANALPKSPAVVAAVEIPEQGISALDAALVLRAVLRYEPRAVAFLAPLRLDGQEALLRTKLAEARVPVLFTSNDRPGLLPGVKVSLQVPPLPRLPAYVPRGFEAGGWAVGAGRRVMIVARQGAGAVASGVLRFAAGTERISGEVPGVVLVGEAPVPVDSQGFTHLNPVAADYVERISFGQLMLQTERSERGSISAALDSKFRGRLVAVQPAGQAGAEGVAALLNHVVERPVPPVAVLLCLLLAASLPWWKAARQTRALLALAAGSAWVLLAIAIYREFQMPLPLLPAMLLPALALIPPVSGKVEQRELPA